MIPKIIFHALKKMRREMAWVVIGQIITFVGGFVGIKMLTNLMKPEGYGQLALGLTISGVMNSFVYGPIGQAMLRFYSVCKEGQELGEYFTLFKRVQILCLQVFLAVAILAGLGVYYVAGKEWGLIVSLSVCFGIISGINSALITLQSVLRERKVVALQQGLDVWARTILAVIFVYMAKSGASGALLGYLLGTLAATLSLSAFSLKTHSIQPYWPRGNAEGLNRKRIHEFFSYAGSFGVFAVFASISLYADRWILQGLSGTKEVGIYTALSQIASAPMVLLSGMVYQFAVPIIFEQAGAMTSYAQVDGTDRLVRATVIITGSFMFLFVFVTFCFGKPLIRLLTTAEVAEYHGLLWVIALGISFFHVAQILFLKGQNYKQPTKYVPAWMLRTAMFLGMGFALTKYYGIAGMAWSSCLSSLLFFIAVYIANRRLGLREPVIPACP